MVLFLTNFFSILLAGGGILAFLGLGAAATKNLQGHARRSAFLIIGLGLVLITIALASTSIRVTRETLTEYQTVQTVKEWLGQSGYEQERIDAHGGVVRLSIFGEGDLPPLADLESALESRTSRPGVLDLTIVQVQRERLEVEPQLE